MLSIPFPEVGSISSRRGEPGRAHVRGFSWNFAAFRVLGLLERAYPQPQLSSEPLAGRVNRKPRSESTLFGASFCAVFSQPSVGVASGWLGPARLSLSCTPKQSGPPPKLDDALLRNPRTLHSHFLSAEMRHELGGALLCSYLKCSFHFVGFVGKIPTIPALIVNAKIGKVGLVDVGSLCAAMRDKRQ